MRRMRLAAFLKQLKANKVVIAHWAKEHDLDQSVLGRIANGQDAYGETWAKITRATKGQVTPEDHFPAKKRRSK